MLVLSRKLEETIVIADDVVIKVIALSNGKVRLGITAPRHISVMRGELVESPKASVSTEVSLSVFSKPCSDQFPHVA